MTLLRTSGAALLVVEVCWHGDDSTCDFFAAHFALDVFEQRADDMARDLLGRQGAAKRIAFDVQRAAWTLYQQFELRGISHCSTRFLD